MHLVLLFFLVFASFKAYYDVYYASSIKLILLLTLQVLYAHSSPFRCTLLLTVFRLLFIFSLFNYEFLVVHFQEHQGKFVSVWVIELVSLDIARREHQFK